MMNFLSVFKRKPTNDPQVLAQQLLELLGNATAAQAAEDQAPFAMASTVVLASAVICSYAGINNLGLIHSTAIFNEALHDIMQQMKVTHNNAIGKLWKIDD